ncbi:MAG: GTP-binding protein [Clostridia bacterium]|nr:GTP-binding protein [Clostridia bacterium]
MTKIDIISGFLGAGKTTLIKKLIAESYKGEKLVLVENEFGEIGVDGGFMQDAGIEVSEINSGCICCSLVGDFRAALAEVVEKYAPDRIIIEPSGVGKLSAVIRAAQGANTEGKAELNSFTAVVDATKAKMYMKNFGEFFNDQIENAGCIILSRTQKTDDAKLEAVVALLREHNPEAVIITTPWDDMTGDVIRAAMEKTTDMAAELMEAVKEEHEHHHHHHDEDGECCCGHHHDDDDEDEHEHHHHHDEDGECCCGHHHDDDDEDEHEHHHHHEHDENCTCGCHDHDHEHHHHDHHADEVFTNWGRETTKKFDRTALETALAELAKEDSSCGVILRAKGIVPCTCGKWLQFDLTPGEYEIREGSASYTGLLCVIGTKLDEEKLTALFGL